MSGLKKKKTTATTTAVDKQMQWYTCWARMSLHTQQSVVLPLHTKAERRVIDGVQVATCSCKSIGHANKFAVNQKNIYQIVLMYILMKIFFFCFFLTALTGLGKSIMSGTLLPLSFSDCIKGLSTHFTCSRGRLRLRRCHIFQTWSYINGKLVKDSPAKWGD